VNSLIPVLALAAAGAASYLLIVRLSRWDERGRQLWRKLITPTPVDAFTASDKEGDGCDLHERYSHEIK
jgi:hypothetical protein